MMSTSRASIAARLTYRPGRAGSGTSALTPDVVGSMVDHVEGIGALGSIVVEIGADHTHRRPLAVVAQMTACPSWSVGDRGSNFGQGDPSTTTVDADEPAGVPAAAAWA